MAVDGDGEAEITEKGGTLQLKAIVEPDSASNKEVTWSVDDESIATIDQNGLLKAVANGTVTVTATAKDGSGKAGSLDVTISGQDPDPVAPNLKSVDKAETEEGYIFTVEAEGEDLGRLHVLLHDGNLEPNYDDIDGTSGKIEYLVLNASEDETEVYGDAESKTKVEGFGVTASYDEASQTWTVTVNGDTLQGVLGTSINLEDIGLFFYVSNEADRNVRSNIIASDFSVN